MRTLVEGALDGYNGCIFAYGQTGAGKTYTMSGNLDGDEDGYGLVPRTALELFRLARKATESYFSFRLSVLEIYNEVLFDLLVEQSDSIPAIAFNTSVATGSGDNAKDSKLTILELDSGVVVPNLRIMPITSAHDAIRLLQEAQANRAIAEHQLNQRSSRSHVIYTFYVTKSATPHHHPGTGASADGFVDPIVHQSKLHLVDLAGSERVNKTGSMGTVQKEANYINRSLSYLEQVVLALTQANRDHIPYRQSKLTHLVKDSLGGNCQTVLVACVWPRRDHAWETLSTMRFAARMKNVETNPVRNRLVSQDSGGGNGQGYVNGGQLRTLQLQVESLKRELALRDFIHRQDRRQLLRQSSDATVATAAADDLWLPDLTKLQRQQTSRNLLRYVLPATSDDDDRDEAAEPLPFTAAEDAPPVEINALSQVHHYLAVMKRALFIACGYDDQRLREALVQAVACVHLSQSVPSGLDALQALAAEALAPGETASNTPAKDATGGGPKVLVGGARRGEERFIGEVLHIAGVAAQAPPATRPVPEADVDAEALPLTSRTQKQTPAKAAPAVSSVLSPDADSQLVGSAQRAKKEELFRQFTAAEGAGRDWQRAYDDACEALKNAKLRQREIVAYLNSNKADIDRLSAETQQLVERLQTRDAVDEADGEGDGDGADEAGTGELSEAERQQLDAELQDSRAKLDEVKRTYRAAYQEMQICKEQIEEMHSLKKRTMTALLTAFDAYYRKLYRAAGDDDGDGGSGGGQGDGDGDGG